MKITAAAANKKYTFDRCVELGKSVNAQVVSIGSALDHCHVPGRQKNELIPGDTAIVGAGIHNEPVCARNACRSYHFKLTPSQGAQRLSPFPSVEGLIQHCLNLLCDPNDAERHFVTFEPNDSVVLVVNNYGGKSNLEVGALTDEIITQLGMSQHGIKSC